MPKHGTEPNEKEPEWVCSFCLRRASKKHSLIDARVCDCGAIGVSDWGTFIDEVYAYFSVPILPSSNGHEGLMIQDLPSHGVEIRKGNIKTIRKPFLGEFDLHHFWFRRSSIQ